jgi:predicted lipoprotein with Yx(FWY)xxD motif
MPPKQEDSMKAFLMTAATAAALTTFATVAMAQAAPTKTASTSKGTVLTDAKGMTLYTFDKDSKGKSACNDKCAVNWPPLMASASAKAEKDYTIITRADGSKQWAHKGMPLYTWIKDKKPGDVTGDGVKKVWHVATP